MIYTVIETRTDGSLAYVRDRNGSPRITTKSWAEYLANEASEAGKSVEVKVWGKLADAVEFVSAHNEVVHKAKIAAKKAATSPVFNV